MRDMATLGIEQIFTSYDNPKGNAETERMLRTIKEEIIWLNKFSSLEDAKQRIGQWMEIDYNKLYVHSELGYISPEEFEEIYLRQVSLKQAAWGDTRIWVSLRKSSAGQMVRLFFDR